MALFGLLPRLLVCLFACLCVCRCVCLFFWLFVCVGWQRSNLPYHLYWDRSCLCFVVCLWDMIVCLLPPFFVCLLVCAVTGKHRNCILPCIGIWAVLYFFVCLWDMCKACLAHGACLIGSYEVVCTTVSWKRQTTPVGSFSPAGLNNDPCSKTFPRLRPCCMVARSVCVASSPDPSLLLQRCGVPLVTSAPTSQQCNSNSKCIVDSFALF